MTTKALGNDARFEEIVPDHQGSYGFQFRIAMNRLRAGLLAIILGISLTVGAVPVEQCQILISPAATRLERFGAREAQRYIYLRTGKVPPVVQRDTLDPQASGAIIIASKNRSIVQQCIQTRELQAELAALKGDAHLLRTLDRQPYPVILLTGENDKAALYATYRFVEHLGVRFYLHGDVIPDAPSPKRFLRWTKCADLFSHCAVYCRFTISPKDPIGGIAMNTWLSSLKWRSCGSIFWDSIAIRNLNRDPNRPSGLGCRRM